MSASLAPLMATLAALAAWLLILRGRNRPQALLPAPPKPVLLPAPVHVHRRAGQS